MQLLWILLIVAADPAASINTASNAPPAAARSAAQEVFKCSFDQAADQDLDGWPDGWTRRRGQGYPSYVKINMVEAAAGEPDCLNFQLNGGAGVAFSPRIQLEPGHSFCLKAQARTDRLKNDRAFITVTLFDAAQQPLETFTSERLEGTQAWRDLEIDQIACQNQEAAYAQIGLHLEPTGRQDIRGSAAFTAIWLGQLPRLKVRANRPHHLYVTGQPIEIVYSVSGLKQPAAVHLELRDALDHTVDQMRRSLPAVPSAIQEADGKAQAEIALQKPDTANKSEHGIDLLPKASDSLALVNRGVGQEYLWKPALTKLGYYKACIRLEDEQGELCRQELSLAVLPEGSRQARGEFGWSVADAGSANTLPDLPALLEQAGVHWLKYPVWHNHDEAQRLAATEILAEQLSSRGMEMVGVLGIPPAFDPWPADIDQPTSAAELFRQKPETWTAALEPAVGPSMLMRLRWWQLGNDGDTSLSDDPKTAELLPQIQEGLEAICQEVHLGHACNSASTLKADAENNCKFQTCRFDAQQGEEPIAAYLGTAANGTQRWIVVQTLDGTTHDLPSRASHLVHAMLAAKRYGADCIFLDDALSPRTGVLNADGTPAGLFMPWRTTAVNLAGTEYLGSLAMPGGSPNHVFAREEEAVLVVWNPDATEELLCLGAKLSASDVWGRTIAPKLAAAEGECQPQSLKTTPLPVFVTGMSASVARTALSVSFAERKVPANFGESHANTLNIHNGFGQTISGQISVKPPDGWLAKPHTIEFKLEEGERLAAPIEFTLPFNANSGPQQVRLDFNVQTDDPCQFTAWQELVVGFGKIVLEATARFDANGDLLIEQRLTNNDEQPVNFQCDLFAPGRRRMRTNVRNLDRGANVQTLRIAKGRDLMGQTLWIRAVERGGDRVLNQRVEVRPAN